MASNFRLNNPICPACLSTYSKLFCSECVLRGSITASHNREETYCDKMRKLEMAKSKCQKLLSETKKLSGQKRIERTSKILEKKAIIAELRRAIELKREQMNIKRCELDRLSRECRWLKHQSFETQNKQRDLTDSRTSLGKKTHKYWHETATLEDRLALVRTSLCRELIATVFPIQVSNDPDQMDKICDVALYTNKQDIATGPEPNISSQTALQHIVVATRALASLLDVWLPISSKRTLSLGRQFASSEHILRDDLARVYQAVAKYVRLLSASQRLSPQHHFANNPLAGLKALTVATELGRRADFQLDHGEMFEHSVSGELEDRHLSWNTPLSGVSGQDWVEVSNDVPFDAAILAYEQQTGGGGGGGIGPGSSVMGPSTASTTTRSSYISSTIASVWRWTAWSTSAASVDEA